MKTEGLNNNKKQNENYKVFRWERKTLNIAFSLCAHKSQTSNRSPYPRAMNFTILVEVYLLIMYIYFMLHIEVESQRWVFKDMIIRCIYPTIWQSELHPNTRIFYPIAMNFTILVEASSWQCTQFVCMPNSKKERFLTNQWIFTR